MDKHGTGLSEKEGGPGLQTLRRTTLLSLYEKQLQDIYAKLSREDLEKEVVQFAMTQAYQFPDHTLRWILAVGAAMAKAVTDRKYALND